MAQHLSGHDLRNGGELPDFWHLHDRTRISLERPLAQLALGLADDILKGEIDVRDIGVGRFNAKFNAFNVKHGLQRKLAHTSNLKIDMPINDTEKSILSRAVLIKTAFVEEYAEQPQRDEALADLNELGYRLDPFVMSKI